MAPGMRLARRLIPGLLFIGLGLGLIANRPEAGAVLGLGAGLLAYGVVKAYRGIGGTGSIVLGLLVLLIGLELLGLLASWRILWGALFIAIGLVVIMKK